jgi:ribosomal protein S12 methylthiotransferase accessory factor
MNGTSRIIPVEKTLSHVSEIAKKIGLTRIADITYMDKLYIPNYSSVLPGTEDYIWVYSGKVQLNSMQRQVIMESIDDIHPYSTSYTKICYWKLTMN